LITLEFYLQIIHFIWFTGIKEEAPLVAGLSLIP